MADRAVVLILRWRARIFCSAVERQASERRQLEEREECARAAVPGAVSFDEMMQTIRRELVLPDVEREPHHREGQLEHVRL